MADDDKSQLTTQTPPIPTTRGTPAPPATLPPAFVSMYPDALQRQVTPIVTTDDFLSADSFHKGALTNWLIIMGQEASTPANLEVAARKEAANKEATAHDVVPPPSPSFPPPPSIAPSQMGPSSTMQPKVMPPPLPKGRGARSIPAVEAIPALKPPAKF